MLTLDAYPLGFEEDECMRSTFMRALTLRQAADGAPGGPSSSASVPKTLVRYWHDPHDVPRDVADCLASWDGLRNEGFDFRMFNDDSAADYVSERYGSRELAAFRRCGHPAMRSDFLRLCFILAEGGFYVDADDVLLGDGWKTIFRNGALKLQPLCYDIQAGGMLSPRAIWRRDLPTAGRIFYVNNDPLAAPAGHPLIRRALARATDRLLREDVCHEIQSTTGPGNLTAALVAHARDRIVTDASFDFELLQNWEAIAETRWDLGYRSDARNWRNWDPLKLESGESV